MKYIVLILSLLSLSAVAAQKDLPYKSGNLSADELAKQVYFVNHFFSFKNYGISKKDKEITALILRAKDDKPLTLTLERYLNNNYKDGAINTRDLAIFRSGKLKGTGMLITDFVDQNKSQSYEIFIPAIRKVRRFAQPARDDAWGGSDFSFGDVTLRKPKHETHEIIAKTAFKGCMDVMNLPSNQRNKYTVAAKIEKDCSANGKAIYKLKSTAKNINWWYDYRISYVDSKSYVDYRTEYFKNGEMIKIIDRSWVSARLDDPRANYWGYWYGKNLNTGHESLAFIPSGVTQVNHQYAKSNLWSTKTLRKIPRKIK